MGVDAGCTQDALRNALSQVEAAMRKHGWTSADIGFDSDAFREHVKYLCRHREDCAPEPAVARARPKKARRMGR
eukprot:8077177-Lingulodinium_polyedra.AAC.1